MRKIKCYIINLTVIVLICCNHVSASDNLDKELLINKLIQIPTTREDWTVEENLNDRKTLFSEKCSYFSNFGGEIADGPVRREDPIGYYCLEKFVSKLNNNFFISILFRKDIYKHPANVKIIYILEEKYKVYGIELAKKFKGTFFNSLRIIYVDTSDKINKSLQFFYKINAVPDFIIDRILEFPEFGVQDFRLNAEKLIGKIEQKFALSTSNLDHNAEHLPGIAAEDLLDFIQTEIKTIKNEQQRQETCWGVIQYLKQQDYCPDILILELGEYIDDDKLPFYSAAQQSMAEIYLAQKNEMPADICNHYRKSMVSLFKASVPNEYNHPIPPLLPTLIKCFINNNKLSVDLPEALANFRYTPEHMYELLNLYRLQNQKIETLEAEIVQLKQL